MSDTDALPISPHQHEMSHDVHSPAKLVGVISKNTGPCHAVHAGDFLKHEWNILSRPYRRCNTMCVESVSTFIL